MKPGKIALLVIFLALLGVVAFLTLTRHKKETLKPIFTADSTSVARIVLKDMDGSMTFSKIKDRWSIAEPVKWEVEEGRFMLFFGEVILEKYSTTPIASGKKALQEYGLDAKQTLQIKVFNTKNKLLKEVWFSNPGNPFDYFCFAGGEDVYQIRQKVASFYAPRFESWRSPHVLRLFSEQMLSIAVQHTQNIYELTRRDSIWHYKDKNEDFDIPAHNQTFGKILNILTQLGSYSMLTGKDLPSKAALGAAVCEVTITQTSGEIRNVKFYQQDHQYLMAVDNHPDMLFVVLFDTVFRFTRQAPLFRAKYGYPEL